MYKDLHYSIEARVSDLLDRMTRAEKIGQMTQVEKNSISPAEVTNKFIGSVLSGGAAILPPIHPLAGRRWCAAFKSLRSRPGSASP